MSRRKLRELEPGAYRWVPGFGLRLIYPPHFGKTGRGTAFSGIWHIEAISCGWGYKLQPGDPGKTLATMVRISDGHSFVTDLPWLRFWKRHGQSRGSHEPVPFHLRRQQQP